MSPGWLPSAKRAAVILHIDDVHPGTSTDPYEAGGDLERGALRHVLWLLERHPQLHVTLFTTADWREISPTPTRRLLARVPWLNRRLYLARRHPRGRMRLDRHPEFVAFLRSTPRTDVALHGLHHVHPGPMIPWEFQEQSCDECREMLRAAIAIFRAAGLPFAPGMTPPGFSTPAALLEAMTAEGLEFVASARDIRTEPRPGVLAAMSGLTGVPLLEPELLPSGLVHIPTNYQATSSLQRAHAILESGGLLSIKGHIIKDCMGHIALDGLDEAYREHLHAVFSGIEDRWGDAIWWTSMAEITTHMRGSVGAMQQSLEGTFH
jgi:hypothetical protein